MMKIQELEDIFMGLNDRARAYLRGAGYWTIISDYPPIKDGQGLLASNQVIKRDDGTYDEESYYVCGKFERGGRTIPAFPYKTEEVKVNGDVVLFRYMLNDQSYIYEVIDYKANSDFPVLCLEDENGDRSFEWSDVELENRGLLVL